MTYRPTETPVCCCCHSARFFDLLVILGLFSSLAWLVVFVVGYHVFYDLLLAYSLAATGDESMLSGLYAMCMYVGVLTGATHTAGLLIIYSRRKGKAWTTPSLYYSGFVVFEMPLIFFYLFVLILCMIAPRTPFPPELYPFSIMLCVFMFYKMVLHLCIFGMACHLDDFYTHQPAPSMETISLCSINKL